jgi:alpha-tubulin suppressor-like RCC1 family protein
VRLAGGGDFTCGQTAAGETWCWGTNTAGQMGDGTTLQRLVPVQVGVLAPVASVTVAPSTASITAGATAQLTVTLKDAGGNTLTGRTVTWNSSAPGIASVDGNGLVTAVAAGTATVTATSEGVSGTASVTVTGAAQVGTLSGQIAAYDHTCAIRAGGQAWCWGYNGSGALGTNRFYYPDGTVPGPVNTTLRFTQLAVGVENSCGIALDSLAYCWGSNSRYALGDGTNYNHATPLPVAGSHKFVQLSMGWYDACGLTPAGDIYCWGFDTWSQVGPTSQYFGYYAVPTPAKMNLSGVTFAAVSLGAYHSCGL